MKYKKKYEEYDPAEINRTVDKLVRVREETLGNQTMMTGLMKL